MVLRRAGVVYTETGITPSRYRLVVKWETVEDHMVHFRESADFGEWRKLVGSHFAAPPNVEHTRVVLSGF